MTIAEKIIKPKLGVLELAQQLGNVSKACKVAKSGLTATPSEATATVSWG